MKNRVIAIAFQFQCIYMYNNEIVRVKKKQSKKVTVCEVIIGVRVWMLTYWKYNLYEAEKKQFFLQIPEDYKVRILVHLDLK